MYSEYTENYMDAIMILEEMLTDPDVIQYFKVSQSFMYSAIGMYKTCSG